MNTNRRVFPRLPLVLTVQYADSESLSDYTANLSATGLFIRTERELEVGERVGLVLSFPPLLEPVDVEVEVVRKRARSPKSPAGLGVRIPDDRPDCRECLRQVERKVRSLTDDRQAELRVLVVEDNALVASMYSNTLLRLSKRGELPALGIEVALDGMDGFGRLMRPPPIGLLIADIFMPGMSGIVLLKKIRAEPSLANLPVVVITSGGDREREQVSHLGVTLFLRKPVNFEEVAGAIRTVTAVRASSMAG